MSLTIRPEIARSSLRHVKAQLEAAGTAAQSAAPSASSHAEEKVKSLMKQQFADQAKDPAKFHDLMKKVYGEGYDQAKAEELRQKTLAGDFSWLPPVEFVDSKDMNGGNGAYDAKKGVVYIDRQLAARDPKLAASTYVEEAGHHLDSMLNKSDTVGDEGEMFRRLMAGEKLTAKQVHDIRTENDKGTITVDGKEVEVEFFFDKIGKAIGGAAKAVGKAVSSGAKAVGNAVSSGAKAVGKAVGGAAKAVGKAVGGAAKAVATGVKHVVKGVAKGVVKVAEGIGGALKNFGTGLFEMTVGFGKNLLKGNVGDAFKSVVNGLDRAIFQSTQRFFTGVWDGAKEAADGVTNMLGPIGKPIRAVTDRIHDIGHTALETAFGIGRDAFRLIPDTAVGFVGDVEKAVKLAADGRWGDAAKQFGMAFVNVPVRVGGGMVDMGARFLQGAASVAQTAVGAEPPAIRFSDLPQAQQDYLKRIYGNSVDYDQLRIKLGGPLNKAMSPHTVGNTIYMPENFDGNAMIQNGQLTQEGLETLGHEVGHVWQNQNGGGSYIHRALGAQAIGAIETGDAGNAYNWVQGMNEGKSFNELNAEQQARLMEHVAIAVGPDGAISTADGMNFDNLQGGARNLTPAEAAYLRAAWEIIKSGNRPV